MICPSCAGEKQSMAFVDGRDPQTGKSWGEVREVDCHTCKGTGEVDAGFAARREWGRRMRRARVDQAFTLRELGERLRIPFTRLSQIEQGLEPATEAEGLRIEEALVATGKQT